MVGVLAYSDVMVGVLAYSDVMVGVLAYSDVMVGVLAYSAVSCEFKPNTIKLACVVASLLSTHH
jgi:hypothetical protein